MAEFREKGIQTYATDNIMDIDRMVRKGELPDIMLIDMENLIDHISLLKKSLLNIIPLAVIKGNTELKEDLFNGLNIWKIIDKPISIGEVIEKIVK